MIGKKGEEVMSVWWIAMASVVGVGIVAGVFLFYSTDVDVRGNEADILVDRIYDCLTEQNILIDDVFESDFDIYEICNLNKDSFEEDFYFKIMFLGTSKSIVKKDYSRTSEDAVVTAIRYANENGVSNGESLRGCSCGLECDYFAEKIISASEENGIEDPLLLLALMIQESGCKKSATSESGSFTFERGASYGLMQISGRTWCGKNGLSSEEEECKKTLLTDIGKNLDTGAYILKSYYSLESKRYSCEEFESSNQDEKAIDEIYSGWERAIRSYNGWGCAGVNSNGQEIYADQNFVTNVLTIYEKLKEIIGSEVEEEVVVKSDAPSFRENIISEGISFESDCEVANVKEAEGYPVCVSREDEVFYYKEGTFSEGILKIVAASDNKGKSEVGNG